MTPIIILTTVTSVATAKLMTGIGGQTLLLQYTSGLLAINALIPKQGVPDSIDKPVNRGLSTHKIFKCAILWVAHFF